MVSSRSNICSGFSNEGVCGGFRDERRFVIAIWVVQRVRGGFRYGSQ